MKRFSQTLDLPLLARLCDSCNACSLHFTNSVGHKVKEEKKAAKKPAEALAKGLRSCTFYSNRRKQHN